MVALNDIARAIESAKTARAVTELVHAFLNGLSESEQQQLPWGLSVDNIESATDIALWAVYLARDQAIPAAPNAIGPAYGQAARVFSKAAERLAIIGED